MKCHVYNVIHHFSMPSTAAVCTLTVPVQRLEKGGGWH